MRSEMDPTTRAQIPVRGAASLRGEEVLQLYMRIEYTEEESVYHADTWLGLLNALDPNSIFIHPHIRASKIIWQELGGEPLMEYWRLAQIKAQSLAAVSPSSPALEQQLTTIKASYIFEDTRRFAHRKFAPKFLAMRQHLESEGRLHNIASGKSRCLIFVSDEVAAKSLADAVRLSGLDVKGFTCMTVLDDAKLLTAAEQEFIITSLSTGALKTIITKSSFAEALDVPLVDYIIQWDQPRDFLTYGACRAKGREYAMLIHAGHAEQIQIGSLIDTASLQHEWATWIDNIRTHHSFRFLPPPAAFDRSAYPPLDHRERDGFASSSPISLVDGSTGASLVPVEAIGALSRFKHRMQSSVRAEDTSKESPIVRTTKNPTTHLYTSQVWFADLGVFDGPRTTFTERTSSSASVARCGAAYDACDILYHLGVLVSSDFPPSKSIRSALWHDGQLPHLTDALETYDVERCREYAIRSSPFWKTLKAQPASQPYQILFPTIITVSPGILNKRPVFSKAPSPWSYGSWRDIALLFRTPFPQFNFPVSLYFPDQTRTANLTNLPSVRLSSEQIDLARKFTVFATACIWEANVQQVDGPDKDSCLFLPLKSLEDESSSWTELNVDVDVDWEEMRAYPNSGSNLRPMSFRGLEELIKTDIAIVGIHNPRRAWIPIAVGKENRSTNSATILECIGLPPRKNLLVDASRQESFIMSTNLRKGQATIHPISASHLRTLSSWPSILALIQHYLRVHELNSRVFEHVFTPRRLMIGLTCPSSNLEPNYNRLEYLGDRLLRLFSVAYAVKTVHAGNGLGITEQYTSMSGTIGDNQGLWRALRGLCGTIYLWSDPFNAEDSITPGIEAMVEGPANGPVGHQHEGHHYGFRSLTTLGRQTISDKAVADVVEAIIGAAHLQGGLHLAFKTCKFLNLSMSDVNSWEELVFSANKEIQQLNFSDPECLNSAGSVALQQLLDCKLRRPEFVGSVLRNRHPKSFEYLGTAVLQLMLAELTYHDTDFTTRRMSAFSSLVIADSFLNALCVEAKIASMIITDNSDLQNAIASYARQVNQNTNGSPTSGYYRGVQGPSIIAVTFRALFGALFASERLDTEIVSRAFTRIVQPRLGRCLEISAQ